MEQEQAKFEGWAICEVMGHQRYAGYVTSEAYGTAVLFRVDIPALPERQREMKSGGYVGDRYLPAGTKVTEGATQPYTKLFGAASIYCLTPCTREAAERAVEAMQPRPLLKADFPPDRSLTAAREPSDDDFGGADSDDDLEEDAGTDDDADLEAQAEL